MKKILPKLKIKNSFTSKNINPHDHWKYLLYILFTMIVVLIIFSFYLLFKVKGQQAFQIKPTSSESPVLINENLLKKVTESFESKMIKQKAIIEGVNFYKDPSTN